LRLGKTLVKLLYRRSWSCIGRGWTKWPSRSFPS